MMHKKAGGRKVKTHQGEVGLGRGLGLGAGPEQGQSHMAKRAPRGPCQTLSLHSATAADNSSTCLSLFVIFN